MALLTCLCSKSWAALPSVHTAEPPHPATQWPGRWEGIAFDAKRGLLYTAMSDIRCATGGAVAAAALQ